MATRYRYRCNACGNLTRFDVVATRRTTAFFHYSVGGELAVEEESTLEETVERVTCRWCNSSTAIERLPVELVELSRPCAGSAAQAGALPGGAS